MVYNYAKAFSQLSLIDTGTVILKYWCFDCAFIIDMTVLLAVGKLQIKDSGFISGVDYCNINKFWVVTSSGLFFYLKAGFCRIVQTGLELIMLPLPDEMPGFWACTTIPGFISFFFFFGVSFKTYLSVVQWLTRNGV